VELDLEGRFAIPQFSALEKDRKTPSVAPEKSNRTGKQRQQPAMGNASRGGANGDTTVPWIRGNNDPDWVEGQPMGLPLQIEQQQQSAPDETKTIRTTLSVAMNR